MKRTLLARRTPLKAKSELKRTTALNRSPLARSALHAESAKRANLPKRQRDSGPSAKVVALVWLRDEGRCMVCGRTLAFAMRGIGWSVQHRRARGMGGSRRADANQPQNLILLCGSATTGDHGWVESNRMKAQLSGWAIKSTADPLVEPVLRLGQWVRLDDQGSFTPIDKED